MMICGDCCPLDEDNLILTIVPLAFDAEDHERGRRLNGYAECPGCGLAWPFIEEPDVWEEGDDGRWRAVEWYGHAYCPDCRLVFVEQVDGQLMALSLK